MSLWMLLLSAVATRTQAIGFQRLRFNSTRRPSLPGKVNSMRLCGLKRLSEREVDGSLSCFLLSLKKLTGMPSSSRPRNRGAKSPPFFALKKDILKPMLAGESLPCHCNTRRHGKGTPRRVLFRPIPNDAS